MLHWLAIKLDGNVIVKLKLMKKMKLAVYDLSDFLIIKNSNIHTKINPNETDDASFVNFSRRSDSFLSWNHLLI